jgi:hypothetical protein
MSHSFDAVLGTVRDSNLERKLTARTKVLRDFLNLCLYQSLSAHHVPLSITISTRSNCTSFYTYLYPLTLYLCL